MNTYKKAYPDVKKVVQLEKAQKLCNGVKNDLTTFEETLADLQKKMHVEKVTCCHFGQTWNKSLQKNQVNSLEFCFKHHHHQVTVRFTQLLIHLFKVESILLVIRIGETHFYFFFLWIRKRTYNKILFFQNYIYRFILNHSYFFIILLKHLNNTFETTLIWTVVVAVDYQTAQIGSRTTVTSKMELFATLATSIF